MNGGRLTIGAVLIFSDVTGDVHPPDPFDGSALVVLMVLEQDTTILMINQIDNYFRRVPFLNYFKVK